MKKPPHGHYWANSCGYKNCKIVHVHQECCKFMQIHVILRTFFDENQQSLKFVMLQTKHRNSIFHGPSIVQVDLCILL